MKAIKLASVFAVSAVAAAVSTATFAAEPVFSGTAGLEYSTHGKNHADNADEKAWDSKGELNISIDTGVVRLFIDGDTAEGDLQLDEAVVTQGAVQFGDFDGSISDDGYIKATREIEGEYGDGSVTDLGVRYSVMPGLTVALEMAEGRDGVGFAAKYSQDMGVAALTASVGSYSGENTADKKDVTNYAIGVSVPAGDMATVVASYAGGTVDTTPVGGAKAEAKVGSVVVGATLNVSDALTIGLQHSMNQEAATGADDSNTEIAAFYTAGDVTYYAASLTGDKTKEKTVIGAKASF
jgi:hypothetical protein